METIDYKTKTSLILPFKGIWIVGNGGRSKELNVHYESTADQRYAYDFIKSHKDNGEIQENIELERDQKVSNLP